MIRYILLPLFSMCTNVILHKYLWFNYIYINKISILFSTDCGRLFFMYIIFYLYIRLRKFCEQVAKGRLWRTLQRMPAGAFGINLVYVGVKNADKFGRRNLKKKSRRSLGNLCSYVASEAKRRCRKRLRGAEQALSYVMGFKNKSLCINFPEI